MAAAMLRTGPLVVLGLSTLTYVFSQLLRNATGVIGPELMRDLALSPEALGVLASVYALANAVMQVPVGLLLDRIGARRTTYALLAFAVIGTVGFALADSGGTLTAARFMMGIGVSGAYVGGVVLIARWYAAERFAGVGGVFLAGGNVGALLATTPLALAAAWLGWRGAFLFTGLLGVAWIAGWLVLSRRDDIRRAAAAPAAHETPPRLSDRRVWGFLLCYALGALPLGFAVYSAAIYLSRNFAMSQTAIGAVAWIPPLGSELGIFFWGWLADRIGRGAAPARLLPVAAALSLPLALLPYGGGVPLALAQFFFAMFVASAFQLLAITYAAETFSKAHAGFIGGLGSGAYGAALALLMPRFGALFDAKLYGEAFLIAALCPALGYLLWLMLARKVDPSATAALHS